MLSRTTGFYNPATGAVAPVPPVQTSQYVLMQQPLDWEAFGRFLLVAAFIVGTGLLIWYGVSASIRQTNYDYVCNGSTADVCRDTAKMRAQHEDNDAVPRTSGLVIYVAPRAPTIGALPASDPPAAPHAAVAPAAPMSAPAGVVGGHRAEQQAACDEQAAKRRALGIPSQVVWDNQYTCRATGGHVETGKI